MVRFDIFLYELRKKEDLNVQGVDIYCPMHVTNQPSFV
jgi:hypothetical protein